MNEEWPFGTSQLDTQTGKQMRTLDGHAGAISAVIFAPDNRTVATVSGLPAFDGLSKGILALANVLAGDKKPELDAELNKLTGDRTIKLWDAQTGKAVKTMNAEAHASFLLSPDGSLVINRGHEKIKAWDALSGQLKWETSEVEISILDNDPFTPDGKLLVAGTKYQDLNSAIKLLDARTGQIRWSLPDRGYTSFSPDGQTLVCFSSKHASFWDLGTGKLKWSIATPQVTLSQNPILAYGKLVAVYGQHYAIELRDARGGGQMPNYPIEAVRRQFSWSLG